MFVLRSKVTIADESDSRAQFGVWEADWQQPDVAWRGNIASVKS